MRLKEHTTIITGAARGIGQQLALAFVREGSRVVLFDRSSLEETLALVADAGVDALGITGDVTDSASIEECVSTTLQKFGRIDTLVNNAAHGGRSRIPFEEISEDDWDLEMRINVKGVWLFCKAVVPAMKSQERGRIINFSSMTVWGGMPYLLHYSASKGAVLSLTRSLARELSGTGINVNAVTPGWHTTPAAAEVAGNDFDATRERMLERQIVKRTGRPSDLNGAVVFLASDEAEFVSGQTLNVDGGLFHH